MKPDDSKIPLCGRHLAMGSMSGGLQEMVNIGSPDYFNSDRNSCLRRRRSGPPVVGFLMRTEPREIGLDHRLGGRENRTPSSVGLSMITR